jgi:hypothetical protein
MTVGHEGRSLIVRFITALDELGPVSPASELGIASPRAASVVVFRAARHVLAESLRRRKTRKNFLVLEAAKPDDFAEARAA